MKKLIGIWALSIGLIAYTYACGGPQLPRNAHERAIYCANLARNTQAILQQERDPAIRAGVRLQAQEYAEEAGCP